MKALQRNETYTISFFSLVDQLYGSWSPVTPSYLAASVTADNTHITDISIRVL